MIKRFTSDSDPQLSKVIDNLIPLLKTCSRYQSFKKIIQIDSWENVKSQMQYNQEVAEKGFGFCITNFRDTGIVPLIVINMTNCYKAKLTTKEISAIIIHEIGHILNVPTFVKVPSFYDCFEDGIRYNNKREEISLHNALLSELYADSYATIHGFDVDLISTFDKHISYFSTNDGFYEPRVDKLKSKKILEGQTLDIKMYYLFQ